MTPFRPRIRPHAAPARRAAVAAGTVLAVALAAALAGCGGGSKPATTTTPTEQQVRGAGYTYTAPFGWQVAGTDRGTTATGPGSQLLSVTVYRLVKPYVPARFAAAARELDGVAARLAAGRSGKVAASRTVKVAGRDSRSYRITYAVKGTSLQQEVTFVLSGRTEWQLVCRRTAADPDAPCATLLSSFAIASR